MPRKAHPWLRSSTGEWYVTHNGDKKPLGVFGANNEAAAWAAFQKLLENTVEIKPKARSEPLASILPDYLSALGARATAKTLRDYSVHLRSFIAPFGNRAANEIDGKSLELHASKKGWSDSYQNNWLWTVQAFIRWAGRPDFSVRRPAKESRGAKALISEDTQRLILRETKGDFHELCRLLWMTGCRPMEAASITAEMVDWTSGTITLKKHKTKHKGKRRIIYLSPDALTLLKTQSLLYDGKGPLFRGIGGEPFSIHAIVTRMIRVSKRIGRSVTAYGYRHSFATRALAIGTPDTHVAALLGHTSTTMIHAHYSHLTEDSRLLRDAAARIG